MYRPVGGSGWNTRGTRTRVEKGQTDRQTDRQGKRKRAVRSNCFGLHGLGKPVTATVKVRRDKEGKARKRQRASQLPSFPDIDLFLFFEVLSKPKATDTPRQQHHAADSARKPGRLDRPRGAIGPGKLLWGLDVCDSSSSDNIRYSAMCTPIVATNLFLMIDDR